MLKWIGGVVGAILTAVIVHQLTTGEPSSPPVVVIQQPTPPVESQTRAVDPPPVEVAAQPVYQASNETFFLGTWVSLQTGARYLISIEASTLTITEQMNWVVTAVGTGWFDGNEMYFTFVSQLTGALGSATITWVGDGTLMLAANDQYGNALAVERLTPQ